MADDGDVSSSVWKIARFRGLTGVCDLAHVEELLDASSWDLNRALSSFFRQQADAAAASHSGPSTSRPPSPALTRLAWQLISFPFFVVSSGVGLVSSVLVLGVRIADGFISRSLRPLGILPSPSQPHPPGPIPSHSAGFLPSASGAPVLFPSSDPFPSPSNGPSRTSSDEAAEFVATFYRDYSGSNDDRPQFLAVGFSEALLRSHLERRPVFVYLHCPNDEDYSLNVQDVCRRTLCDTVVARYLNCYFVCWGGNIMQSEGSYIAYTLSVTRYPFCAVARVQGRGYQILWRNEGRITAFELLDCLHLGVGAEDRRNIRHLREEQDDYYRAALEADIARERKRREEQKFCKRAQKRAALARRRQEKAMSLGVEPEEGPDVTTVRVRFPNGLKERRFHKSATISSLYDFVDSLDCLDTENYSLFSNISRLTYGPETHSLTLEEAGLHCPTTLFIQYGESSTANI